MSVSRGSSDDYRTASGGLESRPSKRIIPLILIAVLPLTIGFLVVLAGASILPYFSHNEYNFDPAYPYLFNGMGLMRGFAPKHVDHPGTPLQMLAGIVSLADWSMRRLIGATTLSFETAVLNDPESYLLTISAVLLLLNVIAVYYLGLKIARWSGSLAVALLAQAGYLLFASQLPRFAYVSPEALTIFSATIVMGLLSPYLFSSDPQSRVRIADPILVGAFLAVGLISKITFLPLVALLLLIPKLRWKLVGLASLSLFSVALFSPARARFFDWLSFILRILRHSQYYGEGPSEFLEMAAVPARMMAFWQTLPAIYVGFVAAALVGVFQLFRSKRPDRTFWQAGIFCAIIFLGLLSAIKHFGYKYAIPSLAIVPPVLAWSIFQFLQIFPARGFRQGIAVACGIGVTMLSIPGILAFFAASTTMKAFRVQELSSLNAVLAQHAGAIRIGGYGARIPEYAIEFGLVYVQIPYQKIVAAGRSDMILYSGANWLDVIGEGLRDAKLANDLVESGREVLLVLPQGIEPPAILKVELLYHGNYERLFLVLKSNT